MNYKRLKKEIFYIRKSFLNNKQGFKYLYNRYFLAKKIFKLNNFINKNKEINNLSIHILTQHADIIMTCWSLATFYIKAGLKAKLYIHNDGSLTAKDKQILTRLFRPYKIVEPEEILNNYLHKLDEFLEIKNMRIKNKTWWSFKKLIDPYLVSAKEYRLIIDSDLIWVNQAKEILEAIDDDKSLITFTDHTGGFTRFKDGSVLKESKAKCNSGLVLYREKNFNLAKLTEYLQKVDFDYSPNKHFIEQAGYAECLDNLEILPPEKYHVKGGINDKTVIKHYTNPRRVLFYIEALPLFKKEILK